MPSGTFRCTTALYFTDAEVTNSSSIHYFIGVIREHGIEDYYTAKCCRGRMDELPRTVVDDSSFRRRIFQKENDALAYVGKMCGILIERGCVQKDLHCVGTISVPPWWPSVNPISMEAAIKKEKTIIKRKNAIWNF